MGTIVRRYIVTDTGSTSCILFGRPFLLLFGHQQGSAAADVGLPFGQLPIPAGFGDIGEIGGTVVAMRGEQAVFFMKYSDVPAGSTPCYQVDGFDFTPPGVGPVNGEERVGSPVGHVCSETYGASSIFPASVRG
jgi:hypothetical protein